MPNNTPACTTYERLLDKKNLIDAQLNSVDVPLRYALYLGADKECLEQIKIVKREAVALKIFMGCSTGGLLIDTDEALEACFQHAQASGILVAVHAEDEVILKKGARALQRGL